MPPLTQMPCCPSYRLGSRFSSWTSGPAQHLMGISVHESSLFPDLRLVPSQPGATGPLPRLSGPVWPVFLSIPQSTQWGFCFITEGS